MSWPRGPFCGYLYAFFPQERFPGLDDFSCRGHHLHGHHRHCVQLAACGASNCRRAQRWVGRTRSCMSLRPVVMVLDWLIAPGERPLNSKALWGIVTFPILWAGYTLVRGAMVVDPRTGDPWYPYPFLNPHTSANGYFRLPSTSFLSVCSLAWSGRRLAAEPGRRRT